MVILIAMDTNLVGVNKDEQVVHAHSQHQEGYDLEHDEGGGHLHVAVEPKGRHHRHQHQQHSKQAHHQLCVNLREQRKQM